MIGYMPSRVGPDPSQRPASCLRVDLSARSRDGARPTGQASSDLIGAWPIDTVAVLSARLSGGDHHHRYDGGDSHHQHAATPTRRLDRPDRRCIIGVDTHKDIHVAVAIDQLGVRLEELHVPTTTAGYTRLRCWANELGSVEAFGVEGTGSYGAGLARYLTSFGDRVVEINRPDRATRHRLGKSDPIDAEMAARSVLAGVATGQPKHGNGKVEMVRMLKMAKDSGVKARTRSLNQMKALLVTAPSDLREELADLSVTTLLQRCAAFRPGELTCPAAVAKYTLRLLARRNLELHEEIKNLSERIRLLVGAASSQLLEIFGVGPDGAATFLVTAGDNPNGFAPRPPSRPSAGRVRSQHPPARPSDFASTAAVTGRPTPRCIGSSSSVCAGTSPPRTT